MIPARLRNRIAISVLALTFAASVWHVVVRPLWRKGESQPEVEIHVGHWFLNTSIRAAFDQAVADYDHNPYELTDVYFREDGGDAMFTACLNVLAKHGCRFTPCVALEWAKAYANLPSDLEG